MKPVGINERNKNNDFTILALGLSSIDMHILPLCHCDVLCESEEYWENIIGAIFLEGSVVLSVEPLQCCELVLIRYRWQQSIVFITSCCVGCIDAHIERVGQPHSMSPIDSCPQTCMCIQSPPSSVGSHFICN